MSSELKVDKITPASGTNTQIGEAGDTTNLSAGTVTLPTTIITGQSAKTSLADADKFLISDSAASGAFKYVESQYIGGGSLVQTAHYVWNSGDTTATIQNCFNSTYRNYLIIFTRFQLGSNDEEFQFKPVNSSGNSESANTYTAQARHYTGSGTGTAEWNGSNDNNITIMKNQASGAGKFISGHMYYFDPMDTTDGIKGYTWMARARKNGDYTGLVYGGGGNATTSAYTGIKITTSNGTITNGLFTVYGIVNGS
tara:strand:+ start:369 stop:1130 length:762 start_codon:yes stop_codon:yes gene_type:complete